MYQKPVLRRLLKHLLRHWLVCVGATIALLPTHSHAESLKYSTIDLPAAIEIAINHNLTYQLQQVNQDIAMTDYQIARSAYEPQLYTNYSQSKSQYEETVNTDLKIKQTQAGIRGILPWGTRYQLFSQNNTVTGFQVNPTLGVNTDTFEINQPLLKGLGIGSSSTIRQAKIGTEIEKQKSIFERDVLIRNVTFAYIDAFIASENLKITQQSAKLAEKLLNEEKQRFELGKAASSAVFRPEAAVAQRISAIHQAQKSFDSAMNTLHSVVFSGEVSQGINFDLKDLALIAPSHQHDQKSTLSHREDYQAALLQVESQKVAYQSAKRNRLPQLDLVIRHNAYDNGDIIANGNLVRSDNYIGAQFSIPILNGTGRSQVNRSKLSLKAQKAQLHAIEQQIYREIKTSEFAMSSDKQQMKYAKKAVALVQKALEAEEEKMAVGRSSSFYILDLQTQLAFTKQQALVATGNYYKAITEYSRVLGIL